METLHRLRILVSGEITPVIIELTSRKKEVLEFLSRVAQENSCFSLTDSFQGESNGNLQVKIRVVVSIADLTGSESQLILNGVDSGKIPTVDVTCPQGLEIDEDTFAKELGSFVNLSSMIQ